MDKLKKRTKYNDSWMYIILLTSLVILTESLKTYNFNIMNIELTFSIFLIPFIYAITNYITKKYGFRKGLTAILISTVSIVIFVIIMCFAVGKNIELSSITGELLGYFLSQLLNTMIYKFLLVNTNSPYLLVLLNYIFGYIFFYMIYTVVNLNMIILDTFWLSYFVVLIIQSVISIALSVVDKKIPVGIGKDD